LKWIPRVDNVVEDDGYRSAIVLAKGEDSEKEKEHIGKRAFLGTSNVFASRQFTCPVWNFSVTLSMIGHRPLPNSSFHSLSGSGQGPLNTRSIFGNEI